MTSQEVHDATNSEIIRVQYEGFGDLIKLDGKSFTFATLICGKTYQEASNLLREAGIDVPSSQYFYRIQKVILEKAKELAEKSVKNHALQLEPGTVITIDAHFSHVRNADECEFVAMGPKGDTVAKFVIVRSRKGKAGNYTGASCQMESVAADQALQILEDTVGKGIVDGFCHDRDNKSRNIVHKHFPDAVEYQDGFHCKKKFELCWKRLTSNEYAKSDMPIVDSKNFHGIKNRLKIFFNTLLDKHISKEQKLFYWLHAVDHLIGNHSPEYCLHSTKDEEKEHFIWTAGLENENARNHLLEFLKDSGSVFQIVNPDYATHINESYNARSCRFNPKHTNYLSSYEGRTDIATIYHNEGYQGLLELRNLSGIKPIHPILRDSLIEEHKEKKLRSEREKTEEYRSARSERRKARKLIVKGKGDYGNGQDEEIISNESQNSSEIPKYVIAGMPQEKREPFPLPQIHGFQE